MKSAYLIFAIGLLGCGSTPEKADASDATMGDSPAGDANADDGNGGGDGSPVDSGSDALDAGDAADVVPATYNDITNGINWQSFGDVSLNYGYATPTFDGKFVYYAPCSLGGGNYHGHALKFDTTGSFQNNLSYASFDITQLNSNAKCYLGTAFDGRYVYYTPTVYGNNGLINTFAVRYDTKASFTNGASWGLYDLSAVDVKAGGYAGAAFDGRYIYMVPYIGVGAPSLTVRYDTKGNFTSGASWQKFDIATKDAAANTYSGAVFDGRYIYYVPSYVQSRIARFDTQGTFTDGNAWTLFDPAVSVNPASTFFSGGTFDGRYVYFIPQGQTSVLTRYDTQGSFTNKASWSTFNLPNWKSTAVGFWGAVFDGRYVNLVPSNYKLAVRYDTTASFTAAGSYDSFDLGTFFNKPLGFYGAAFDGEFIYYAAASPMTQMARFDAKTPPSIPATYNGSFY